MLNISLNDANADAAIGPFYGIYRESGCTKILMDGCICTRKTDSSEHKSICDSIQDALKIGVPVIEIEGHWTKRIQN